MRYLSSLLLLTSFATFGQINIHLKSGEVLTTNYAYLHSSHKSYVKVEEGRKGKRIRISEVEYIEGPDELGNNRYFRPVDLGYVIWAERWFTSEHITIYHTDIMVGSTATTYKPKSCVYSKDDGPIRKLKYSQLKKDLSDCPASMEFLKKGKKVMTGQILIYSASYSLIFAGAIITMINKDNDAPTGQEASSTPPVSPLLYVGAAGAWIPFLMNDARNRHYLEALKVYE